MEEPKAMGCERRGLLPGGFTEASSKWIISERGLGGCEDD